MQEDIAQMRHEGRDETTIARIAWQRELKIQAEEKQGLKGIKLTSRRDLPRRQ